MKKEKMLINIDDIRIAKLYSVVDIVKDDTGKQEGIETSKFGNFVLLQKITVDKYLIVPTEKLIKNNMISVSDAKVKPVNEAKSTEDLVINKIDKNNRYLHPSHICYDLHFKKLTPSQLVAFATLIGEINSDAEDAYEQIKDACEKINNRVIEDYKNEVLARESERVVVRESAEDTNTANDKMKKAFKEVVSKREAENSLTTEEDEEEVLTK